MLVVRTFVPSGPALAEETDPSSPDCGKKFFLWNALPGEIVEEFSVLKKKRSYVEAVAEKIAPSSVSEHRVSPRDPCFLATSPYQILSWDYELSEKRRLVAESLAQEKISYSCEISPVKTDNREWNYRNKMEYALYWDNSDNKIYPAFRSRGSHRKIPLGSRHVGNFRRCEEATAEPKPASPVTTGARTAAPEMPACASELCSSIERREIAKRALKIVQELNSAGASARDYQSLLLRVNREGIVSGGLLPNGKSHPVFPNLTDEILGQEYSYSPNGFFQVNLPVYELALEKIKKYIVSDRVLDLYSGVGTIGLSVARDKNLTLVESNPSAFRELEKNAAVAGEPQAVFCKSEDALDYISPDETVILDPPRAGCDRKLIDRLCEEKPERIIYLSCNPSTQARDIRLLLDSSAYEITAIAPFNFFPKTPHIENLIILSRI